MTLRDRRELLRTMEATEDDGCVCVRGGCHAERLCSHRPAPAASASKTITTTPTCLWANDCLLHSPAQFWCVHECAWALFTRQNFLRILLTQSKLFLRSVFFRSSVLSPVQRGRCRLRCTPNRNVIILFSRFSNGRADARQMV